MEREDATDRVADLYNRQLHPDERQWAKDNAAAFAKYYERKTGQAITQDQAEKMLLANGYIRVDSFAASGGGGYDKDAAQYLSENAGELFTKDQYYTKPFAFGNVDGSSTPEQKALPGGTAVPGAGKVAAAGLGLTVLGAASPAVATAWALGTAYDFTGDTISHAIGLSKDSPDFTKSFTVGGIGAAAAPFVLPLETLGSSAVGKTVVGIYNSLWAGTTSFAATSVTTPSSSPSLAGGLGTFASGAGLLSQSWLPKPLGDIVNQVIQTLPGPIQTSIENSSNTKK